MDKNRFLASKTPIAREVTFADGTKETLHFLQLSAGEFRRFQEAATSDNLEERLYSMQSLIVASLCDDKGELVFSAKDRMGLTMQGVNDLFPHVMAVSGVSAKAKKESPSADPTGSATS